MNSATILLINPMSNILRAVTRIAQSGEKSNVTFCIVKTAKSDIDVSQCKGLIQVVDLKTDTWNTDAKFVSGIAFDYAGQVLLESVKDQILLPNAGTQELRLSNFLKQIPGPGNLLIETISYFGRHIVIAAWTFLEGNKLQLVTDFDTTFKESIETVYETLDNAKVINGPAQVYLGSQHQVLGIKLHPSNIAYEVQKKGTNRSWLDVWPMVCSTFISNQTSAFRKFYEWSDVTGKSKTYKASPLTI